MTACTEQATPADPAASVNDIADRYYAWALQRAPAYQHPRRVIFLDSLPLAGPGKIDAKTLKTEAEALSRSELRSTAAQ